MNRFTEALWEIISDQDALLAEVAAIMRRQYPPFLSPEQTLQANRAHLEHALRDHCAQWYDWLPDTPINHLGGALAQEALDEVEWQTLAACVLAHT